jgi:glycosyltransferase involved in cell wall biosynthesis
MAQLAESYPVFALIPGPARGYLIQGLKKLGVPYRNDGHVPHSQITSYYHASDLYIIPGREEGGPAAVLESLASGTPLVSNRVGMAPDVIQDGQNGFLVEVGDVDEMVQKASRLLESQSLRQQFCYEGLKTIKAYDWSVVARRYGELYASLRDVKSLYHR